MTKLIHLNAFEMNTVGHLQHGLWRHPANERHRYKDIEYWTELAELLERGKFDALFIADVVGVHDVYKRSAEPAIREAVQVPINDPFLLVPAMAVTTKHLGFAVTSSTTYEHPFSHARRMSTLDHLTKGRIAWNIVTSYLPNAAQNYGLAEMIDHDERYERADEYMEVCYKLWEGSWEDDAVVRDAARNVYTDPSKVHYIHHKGKYYSLPGPHLCEPSLQRTPVLFQAGSSARGRHFQAKHVECVFIHAASAELVKSKIADIRQQARQFGRDPASIKVFTSLHTIVGRTAEEAQAKYEAYARLLSTEGKLAHYGASSGYDLSAYSPSEPLHYVATNHGQGFAARHTSYRKPKTVGEIIETMGTLGRNEPFFLAGTPEQVADKIQYWVEETDLDGFNVTQFVSPGTLRDFIELVVPLLQERGLFRKEYEESTMRERLFGRLRLPASHPASAYRA